MEKIWDVCNFIWLKPPGERSSNWPSWFLQFSLSRAGQQHSQPAGGQIETHIETSWEVQNTTPSDKMVELSTGLRVGVLRTGNRRFYNIFIQEISDKKFHHSENVLMDEMSPSQPWKQSETCKPQNIYSSTLWVGAFDDQLTVFLQKVTFSCFIK